MAKCKGCGKPILFAEIHDENGISTGKDVPLDPKPILYRVREYEDQPGEFYAQRMASKNYMVSHFATCPDANKFSNSNRKKEIRNDDNQETPSTNCQG